MIKVYYIIEKIHTELEPGPPSSHISEDSNDMITDKNFVPTPSVLESRDLPLKRLKTTASRTKQYQRPTEDRISKQAENLVVLNKKSELFDHLNCNESFSKLA